MTAPGRAATTFAPSPAPIAAPIAVPIAVPVAVPIAVPIAPPVAPPVNAPVTAPVAAPAAPRHRARWIVGGLGVLGGGLLAWRYLPTLLLGPVITAAPLKPTDLVQTLVASGHVASRFRTQIGTQITGLVTRIPVAEGERVGVGDTLLLLDETESEALELQARGAVQQAAAQLRQLRELTRPSAEQALLQATATRESAELALARNLTALGLDAPAALDQARLDLDIMRAKERAAALLAANDRPGGSTVTLLTAQLAQANATWSAARTRRQYRAIVAPVAGVLIARDVEVGDVAQPGQALMVLSPDGDTEGVVQVDERQFGSIAIGQPAIVSADAFPAGRFAAQIRFINPGIDLLRASVEVRLRVPNPPAVLRQDMTVSVDIETARRPQALVVSTEDIHDLNGGAPWVTVIRRGRAVRQTVGVGLSSGGQSEILRGVVAGETIAPLAIGDIADGHRVRLRAVAARAP